MGSSGIHTRNPAHVQVRDEEWKPSQEWIQNGFLQILTQLKGLRRVVEDRTRPVDEYPSSPTANMSVTSSEIPPQFDENISERIESVLVWGPPASTGTLTLGDMVLTLTIPATGVLVIAPVSMLLNRSDRRILALTPAGAMGMRLMGWADERY